MPTFSQGLEKALHQALTFANERHHEYATLEHLLLALVDDPERIAVGSIEKVVEFVEVARPPRVVDRTRGRRLARGGGRRAGRLRPRQPNIPIGAADPPGRLTPNREVSIRGRP